MNVKRFKMELSHLLCRFSATDGDKTLSSAAASLTTQEIIDAAQEVFRLKLNVNLVDSIRGQATTPASEIVMTIPDAPDIPRFNAEHKGGIAGRIRSFSTLWGETFDNVDEQGSPALKVDENVNVIKIDVPDIGVTHRKLISKSSPEVKTLIRSDTFVRENVSDNLKNDDICTNKNYDALTIDDCGISTKYSTQDFTEILAKLKNLKDSANDVVKKIDDINKDVPAHKNMDENSQSIRRLSAFCPALHRTSMTSRSIQRPKMMRRSMLAALSGTPTSSRLNPEEPKAKDVSATRKSTSTIPITNMEDSKLSVPATYRPDSSGAFTRPQKSATRYDSPAHGSEVSGVNTKRKLSLRSPSLSSLNLRSRSGCKESKNRTYKQAQISKESIALENRKA